jgi:hypothetical protein
MDVGKADAILKATHSNNKPPLIRRESSTQVARRFCVANRASIAYGRIKAAGDIAGPSAWFYR